MNQAQDMGCGDHEDMVCRCEEVSMTPCDDRGRERAECGVCSACRRTGVCVHALDDLSRVRVPHRSGVCGAAEEARGVGGPLQRQHRPRPEGGEGVGEHTAAVHTHHTVPARRGETAPVWLHSAQRGQEKTRRQRKGK